jgi:hypothetical protein
VLLASPTSPRSVPPVNSAPLRSTPVTSTRQCQALCADEPPFAQAEGDVALKAYVASLYSKCFKCFEHMLQVLQAHIAGVVFTNVATTRLYMFQQ